MSRLVNQLVKWAIVPIIYILARHWIYKPVLSESGIYGVYYPVDPSIYSTIYPEDPDKNIANVASLYSELIQLFIDMRYLKPENVVIAPHHSPAINTSYPAKFGLAKNVVDLYQMIPYVTGWAINWEFGNDGGEFIQGGGFLGDLRDHGHGEESSLEAWRATVIDPTYGLSYIEGVLKQKNPKLSWHHRNGPYIKQWYAVLSSVGNHGSTMVLNTQNWHMWLVWQIDGSSDPAFADMPDISFKRTINFNDFDQYPSRPAVEFLEDMINRFKTLEWIPGGLYNAEDEKSIAFKGWYLASGWPDAFDGAKFDRLRKAAEDAEYAELMAVAPLLELQSIMLTEQRLANWKAEIPKVEREVSKLEKDYARYPLKESGEQLERRRAALQEMRRQVYPMSTGDWEAGQEKARQSLAEAKQEKEKLMNREGGFAELSDDDYEKAVSESWYDAHIDRLERQLGDPDNEMRRKRMIQEVRGKARAVDSEARERWVKEKAAGWYNRDNDWERQWRSWFEADD